MSKTTLDDMTEEELARFYQEHKGDPSLWQKTPRRMRRHRGEGPTTSFAIRLTPEEIEELQAAAATSQTTLSEFIRSSALAASRAHGAGTGVEESTSRKFRALTAKLKALRKSLDETETELQRVG